jgi:hypothetical protein
MDTDLPAVRVELQAAVMTVLLVAADLVLHQVADFAVEVAGQLTAATPVPRVVAGPDLRGGYQAAATDELQVTAYSDAKAAAHTK